MITIKTEPEIEIMKAGGKITAKALKAALASAKPGVKLSELEEIAGKEIYQAGGEPAFKRVPGYNFATCINVNEGVVHGIPGDRKLEEGDLVSVDLGTYYKGFNTDASWTAYVGDINKASADQRNLLAVGQRALSQAIAQAALDNHIADITLAMQKVLEEGGYAPMDTLVGHGIGRELHEDPQIPCLLIHKKTPRIKVGMTLAIEVIYAQGSSETEIEEDGWTVRTADGSLSGLFEHTVAITAQGPVVLTEQE
ncbi:MAG: type I methionyl aminopeptidase [Patescibacteria group bacterium]